MEGKHVKFCKYIHSHEVEEYIAQGWTVTFWRYYDHGKASFVATIEIGDECES